MLENAEQKTARMNGNNNNNNAEDNDVDVDVDVDVEANADAAAKLLSGGDGDGKGARKCVEQDQTMTAEINRLLAERPLTADITCGFWLFKGAFLQRFANQNAYVILYGIAGCIITMTYAYSNGTLTTLEKRFKIPSKNTGLISVGNDISQMILCAVLGYYGGKGHRPRWIGFGLITIVLYCLLNALPHVLYGPGNDALALTVNYGALAVENITEGINKEICHTKGEGLECEMGEGNLAPQVILFVSQLISGIGGSLFYTLGTSYMDDNTKKSKTPVLLSFSYFLRTLGPALGYGLASFCLRIYISPELQPAITSKDPRWLGAWWMGWLVMGAALSIFGVFFAMFPRELPRVAARRIIEAERRQRKLQALQDKALIALEEQPAVENKASLKDMIKTFKQLFSNHIFMYNNLSSIFYLFGYSPFWIFTPKYIEIQYRQSAAMSSMVTGTVGIAFSAVGILLSGFIISRYKPRARYLAAWNVIVGFLTVIGIFSYAFIGCPDNEQSIIVNIYDSSASNASATCNSNCSCDYVRYSPVCGENNMTYISACHAGCKSQSTAPNGKKIYHDCLCIASNLTRLPVASPLDQLLDGNGTTTSLTELVTTQHDEYADFATPGACPVNCWTYFIAFLSVMCFIKLVGASGRASNFLVGVRCVPEADKTAAMGLSLMMCSMFAFIPSPIFFGWILDRQCLVWGKTCSNKGNCWLYDAKSLRYALNVLSTFFIAIGTFFDGTVWYYVKDLKVFDEEVQKVEMEIVKHEQEASSEKKTDI